MVTNTIVLLDPGHGANDGGVCRNTFREADFALELCREIVKALTATGWPLVVWQTRYDDTIDPSSTQRADRADALRADLTLALHANSSDPREHGAMALYLPYVPMVAELSAVWLTAMDRPGEYVEAGPTQRMRPMKRQAWPCLPGIHWQGRALSCLMPHRRRPAIILEHDYASNETARAWLMSREGQSRCVFAAVETVRELLRIKGMTANPECLPT